MPTRIGLDESGKVVTVARGQLVEAVLPQNAGTGYEWQLDPLPAGLELLNDRTDLLLPAAGPSSNSGSAQLRQADPEDSDPGPSEPEHALPETAGAVARRVFTIRVNGSGPISARLRRSWDPPESAIQTFTAEVVMR